MSRRRLIEEVLRRKGIVEACFDKQKEPVLGAVERGERQIAILTSRRAGKTNTVLRAICRDALENPNRKYAYIGLSRVTAENIVWKELEAINDNHNLGLEMQGYRLRAIFPNGADITLYGADQPGWLKKFKGAKYRNVVIDEAGEFDIDLQDFIFRVIRPTLTDLQGTLWLIGTPGIVPSGYWWGVTRPQVDKRVKGWRVYQWHSFDNPYIATQFKTDMAELKDIYGDELDNLPWYRREWLGEWCFDTSNNVYKYNADKNDLKDRFEPHVKDQYVLAIDPGWRDATAFVVGVYNPDRDDRLVFLECYSAAEMQLDEIADKAEEYMRRYPGLRLIGDPDSAHFLAFMRERRGIGIEDAQKIQKQQNIQYFNNSLISGQAKFKMPEMTAAVKEMMELKKEFRKSDEREEGGIKLGEWKENPKQPNDFCDCCLYIHRVAINYTYQEPDPIVEYGSQEYLDKVENKLRESALAKARGSQPWWRTL